MPFHKPKWLRRLCFWKAPRKYQAEEEEGEEEEEEEQESEGEASRSPSGRSRRNMPDLDLVEDMRAHLGVKTMLRMLKPDLEAAEANRSINPRPERIAIRTHYSSKCAPGVPPANNGDESSSSRKPRSSSSASGGGKMDLIRTVTRESVRLTRRASAVSARGVKEVWSNGMIDAIKTEKVYNPPIKPPDWCSFVFRGNPWIEDQNDPEYGIPLAVRRWAPDPEKFHRAEDYPANAPPCTPLHQNPEENQRRQQFINDQFMARLENPDIQERPVSPFTDPLHDNVYPTALKHTSKGTLDSDSCNDKGLHDVLRKVIFTKFPCKLCDLKAKQKHPFELLKREADKKEAGGSAMFRSSPKRKRAVTTFDQVDRMETIMSRHPSQTDLTDMAPEAGIEMKTITPRMTSGRPKAFSAVLYQPVHFSTRDPGIGSSSQHAGPAKAGEHKKGEPKPCQQLRCMDSHPPSRQISHEDEEEYDDNGLNPTAHDNASTMALKSRPISAMDMTIEDSTMMNLMGLAPSTQGLPDLVSAEKEKEKKKEDRSSGSMEDAEATTAEGTSALGTQTLETVRTTPEREEAGEGQPDGLTVVPEVMGKRSLSNAEMFDPRDLHERLRNMEMS